MARRLRRAAGAMIAAVAPFAVASCSAASMPSATVPTQAMSLTVSNGTDLSISLVVNGHVVKVIVPQAGAGPIPESALPAAPWSVEARTVSGRVFTSMTVTAQDLVETVEPGGGLMVHIPMARIDLTCGRLTIFAGDHAPSGPVPVPGQGEPCVP